MGYSSATLYDPPLLLSVSLLYRCSVVVPVACSLSRVSWHLSLAFLLLVLRLFVSCSYKFNVLITTPHTLLSDWPVFQTIKWRYVIVDEAHSLKNADSQLAAHVSVGAVPSLSHCAQHRAYRQRPRLFWQPSPIGEGGGGASCWRRAICVCWRLVQFLCHSCTIHG